MPETSTKKPAQPGKTISLPEIKGFIETSFLDWKGAISSVLFLPGCNFACPFCHNFQLVSDPGSVASLPVDWVLERLGPFAGWIDGVVISGGEPTLHPGLPLFIEKFRQAGFKIKLDTNGTNPAMVKQLVADKMVELVAMDIKAPLDQLSYRRSAGKVVDLEKVLETMEFLKSGACCHEFRSTIWPAWHGVKELAEMAGQLEGCQAWTLQALNPETAWNPEALGMGKPYTAEQIAGLQRELADPICKMK
jgi:pyruvate formate lyase activating enzyme